ncbi:MAG: replication terminator protein [Clostridia bacterium]|nr:replication terminator protein [Clostridia bacterium]
MLKLDTSTGEMIETSLLDLIDGGVKELADLNFRRVLDNIRDVNTDPKKARSITVKFTFAPNQDRDSVSTKVQVECKLVPVKPVETTLDIGSDGGKVIAVERQKYTPGQMKIDGTNTDTKIHALRA